KSGRRTATEADAEVESGDKLGFRAANRIQSGGRRNRGERRRSASNQRVLLDLCDEAMVVETLRILMEQTMQLRRNRQREGRKPEEKHRASDDQLADVALPLGCSPKLHAMRIEHENEVNARGILCCYFPQQCLYFFPLLQGQGSFRPTLGPVRTGLAFSTAAAASLTMS